MPAQSIIRRVRWRISCPELIGRERELEWLTTALSRAKDGVPATVFVAGEAGIGKTRLIGDFAMAAGRRATRVLTGHCQPFGGELMPYGPVVEILRAAVCDLGAEHVAQLAGRALPIVAALLPELDAGSHGSWPILGHHVQPQQLASELLRMLCRLADQPTLIVIEDAHWADSSTLELLSLLACGVKGCRLLAVCTYRHDELSAGHPLRPILAQAHRAGVGRISLGRLDLPQTIALATGILREEPASDWSRRLHERSGGIPFLVEELLAAGPDRDALPDDLRDVLLLRFRQLPPAARQTVRAVAIAGRGVEHALLADVSRVSASELIDALEVAVQERILLPDGDGYAFRHALVAEAVVADMLPGERIRLHRAFGEALDARLTLAAPPKPARVAALARAAHHWLAAGDPDRALVATIHAGLAAERGYALLEADRWFRHALELWWEAPAAQQHVSLDLAGLYRHAADAAYLVGDAQAAIGLIGRSLEELDQELDPLRASLFHERLGRYLLGVGQPLAVTMSAYETAARLAPEAATPERARVLAGLAGITMLATRYAEAAELARTTIEVARAAGTRNEEAHGLSTLGTCRVMLGDSEGGIADLKRAVSIATEIDSILVMWRGYLNLADALHHTGHFADAADVALRGLGLLERHNLPREHRNCLMGNALDAMFWHGRWDEMTERLSEEGDPDIEIAVDINMWLAGGALHVARGDFDDAVRCLDLCGNARDSAHLELSGYLYVGHAELCLWRGKPETAVGHVRRALRILEGSHHGTLIVRLLACAARAHADLAPRGDAHAAAEAAQALGDRIGQTAEVFPLTVVGEAHLGLAQAELARLRGADADRAWAHAAQLWQRLESPYPYAYARWRQAEVHLLQRGGRRPAARALAEAHEIATRLGAKPLSREIVAVAKRARLDLGRPVAPGPGRRAAPEHHAALGLTPREEEVLKLLMAGSTNRQIARALYISENTVSIHVSRILAKLSVPNRATAAAAAHRLGLLG